MTSAIAPTSTHVPESDRLVWVVSRSARMDWKEGFTGSNSYSLSPEDVSKKSPQSRASGRSGGKRPSGDPVPLQSSEDFRRSEPDSPTELEGRDLAGNAPLVELTAADLEEGGEFGLGEEYQFVGRRDRG
jgi:hypothetical protein